MLPEAFTILSLLERNGWQTTPKQGRWLLKRRAEEGVIDMCITPHNWLCFSSPLSSTTPSLLAGLTPSQQYRLMLGWNEKMFLAKFALDHNNNPLLMAEIPLKDVHPLLPQWAIESVTSYKTKNPEKYFRTLIDTEWASAQSLTSSTTDTQRFVRLRVMSPATEKEESGVMVGIADNTIALFVKGIENWGWRIYTKSLGFTWHLGYVGHHRMFDVYLTTSKNWVYFQVPVLLDHVASVLTQPIEAENTQQQQILFLKYLLRLNHHYFMAKLGLSEDNKVLLLLEVPTEALDFSLFQQVTRALAIYLDRFEQEIQIMASLQRNKRLFELLHA